MKKRIIIVVAIVLVLGLSIGTVFYVNSQNNKLNPFSEDATDCTKGGINC